MPQIGLLPITRLELLSFLILSFYLLLSLLDPIFHLSTDVLEHVLNVDVVLRTDLKELQALLLGEFLALFKRDFPFLLTKIAFRPYQNDQYFLWRVFFDLFQPRLKRTKRGFVIDGISKNDSLSAFIISLRNGPEPFLSGSIPNLQFDLLAIDENDLTFEIDTWINKHPPMVVICDITKVLAVNLSNKLVFPTPEFPIISNLARTSCWDIV